jgi:hypothetical protein
MPPAYVKPYVKRHKNDAGDAEAICEAVRRPTMRFVETKTPEQQSCLMIHRTRHLFIRKQTAQPRLDADHPLRSPSGGPFCMPKLSTGFEVAHGGLDPPRERSNHGLRRRPGASWARSSKLPGVHAAENAWALDRALCGVRINNHSNQRLT